MLPPHSARPRPLATIPSCHSLSAPSMSLSAAWQPPLCPHQARAPLCGCPGSVSVSAFICFQHLLPLSPLFSVSGFPPPVFLFLPPWDQGRTQPSSVLMAQCGHGGPPRLSARTSLWPGSPPPHHLPELPPLRCVMSDWKPQARPGEDRGSGSFPGGQGGAASQGPAGSEVQLPVQPWPLWSLSLPRGGGLS